MFWSEDLHWPAASVETGVSLVEGLSVAQFQFSILSTQHERLFRLSPRGTGHVVLACGERVDVTGEGLDRP